jgi:alpha-galactosidase
MTKIALIGAGSVTFAQHLIGDILSFPELADSHLALMDIDPIRLQTSRIMAERLAAQLSSAAVVTTTLDRREALRDADYVINAIQVGGYDATLIDFQIPTKYGLRQTIADTLGIGGIFRALRTIPVLLDICHDMEGLCPNALLLNYTNPMAMLCLAVHRAAPEIATVGLCHSVQDTSELLAKYLGIPYGELTYRVAGINHMAWFLELSRDGVDQYPRLNEILAEHPELYPQNKVRVEMLRRTGYFVTESSEHFAEYTPYFMRSQDEIDRLSIPVDEYIRRCQNQQKRFEQTRALLESGGSLPFERSHEYASYIIHSHQTGLDRVIYGNVANTGLIPNLPSDSCVEVACVVNRSGVHPCYAGPLPTHLAAFDRTNINVQQVAVEAALTRKREHVYHAAMLDPNTAATLTLDQIWHMVDELIDAHGAALPALC